MTPAGELNVPVSSASEKKTNTTIAAISAPTEGRTSSLRQRGSCRSRSSVLGAGAGAGAGAVVAIDYLVPWSASAAIEAAFSSVTKLGPVATIVFAPTSLRLRTASSRKVTGRYPCR